MNPELADLAKWAMRQPMGSFKWLAVYDFGFFSTAIVYREGRFQIEMILANPGMRESKTLHRHPNVGAVALGLYGNVYGFSDGKDNPCLPDQPSDFIDNNVWHGLKERLPHGAAVLSVQEWHDLEPATSIALNWEGNPFSKKHMFQLEKSPAIWRPIGAPVREPEANGSLSVQAQGGILGDAQVAPPEVEGT